MIKAGIRWGSAVHVALALAAFAWPARAEPVVRPPVIRHSPPRTALRGQSLALRAQVVPGAAPIRTVTLYGTSSRDAAPFPLRMTSAGAGAFVVTVPGAMIAEGDEFTYYIEALDSLETAGETPWYTVRLRSPASADTPVPLADPDYPPRRTRAAWVTPAVIAGGATLVVGGVALATRDSGSSGSGAVEPGTFSGSVTRVLRVDSASTVDSSGMSMEVTPDRVRSNDLHPDTRLDGALTGSTFILTTNATIDGMQGQIRYVGSVAGDQIAGSIDGEVTGIDGRRGTYSGSFTATRR